MKTKLFATGALAALVCSAEAAGLSLSTNYVAPDSCGKDSRHPDGARC